MVNKINSVSSVSDRAELQHFARLTVFLVALNVMAFYYYGYRAVIISLLSVGVSLLTEYICCTLTGKKFDIKDTSPVVSAMILALLMPASVSYMVVAFASAFMISVCKFAFGGNNNLIFSPAAVAYAFSALTWSNNVLRFPSPVPFGQLPLWTEVTDGLSYSFTRYADISLSSASYLDIIWGKLSGPMGTMSVVIIIICAVSLYFFRDIPGTVLFSGVAVNVLLFVIFPLTATGWTAVIYAMTTGSFMFVLVFMACDFRFAPKRAFAQILYGGIFALLSYLLRRFSGLETAAIFSLLIVSIFSAELDKLDVQLTRLIYFLRKKIGSFIVYVGKRTESGQTDLTDRNAEPLSSGADQPGDDSENAGNIAGSDEAASGLKPESAG